MLLKRFAAEKKVRNLRKTLFSGKKANIFSCRSSSQKVIFVPLFARVKYFRIIFLISVFTEENGTKIGDFDQKRRGLTLAESHTKNLGRV